jgi:hypothetical protein
MEQRQKGEQFRVLDPVVAMSTPSRTEPLPALLMSAALPFGLALGAVVAAEMPGTSFDSVEDLRAVTAVPVSAGIPRIVTEADRA